MRNEKQVSPAPARLQRRKAYWSGSLLLLILPTFQNDRAGKETLNNHNITPSYTALPYAHAHNDYRHDQPLVEALSRGFISVEADVHLVGGELYLGHWIPQISQKNTLREVYLEPLNALMERRQGKVYSNYEGVFYLMVDVKTDSLATWRVLRQQLQQYPLLQCNPYFRVFVSGNRAQYNIQQDSEQVMAVDGRLPDLYQEQDTESMPVISDNFRKYFKWRGKGSMPAHEWAQLQNLATEAHCQGKKLRFWGIPDRPHAWETLLKAGVDLINTDNLAELEQFFVERNTVVISRTDHNHPTGR